MIALVVLLALFVPALSASLGSTAQSDAGEIAESVTGESIDVDYQEPQRVDERADAYSQTVDVRDSEGDPLDEGVDYRWNDRTGAVDWIEEGDTTDGETAEIDYDALDAPAESQTSHEFVAAFVSALPWLLAFVGGLLAIKLVDEGWS